MLHAQLHGKLSREQENLEDILTSTVFGALSYLTPGQGFTPWLSQAEGTDVSDLRSVLAKTERIVAKFWPWLEQPKCLGCEPDVILELYAGEQLAGVVVIEAKYRSGKSSLSSLTDDEDAPSGDQLARQWENARSRYAGVPLFLVFVTAAHVNPRREIAESVEQIRPAYLPAFVLWLSWRALTQVEPSTPLLADVRDLLVERYRLATFTGFTPTVPLPPWQFEPAHTGGFRWEGGRTSWSFTSSDAHRSWALSNYTWRFG